jgi:hypothetical protein
MAEKITKSHPIGSEQFRSIWTNKFKIRILYVKNITFACSLPTSTSTWRSDHRIRPGGYMSGELKSENINMEKSPTQRRNHPAKRPTIVPIYTTKFKQDISTLYSTIVTILERPSKNYKPRPSSINNTLTDCCSPLNAITIDDLEYSLR